MEMGKKKLSQGTIGKQVQDLFNYRIPRVYQSVIKQYKKMAKQNNWTNKDGTTWPVSLQNLLKFLTTKAGKVAPHTLRSYLSALSFGHRISLHFNWDKSVSKHPAVLHLLKNTIRK